MKRFLCSLIIGIVSVAGFSDSANASALTPFRLGVNRVAAAFDNLQEIRLRQMFFRLPPPEIRWLFGDWYLINDEGFSDREIAEKYKEYTRYYFKADFYDALQADQTMLFDGRWRKIPGPTSTG